MTTLNLHKWKKIIGPEYDIMVKKFLSFINDFKRDSEKSNLIIPEKLQEKLLTSEGNQEIIPDNSVRNLMKNDEVMAEFPYTAEVVRIINDFENRRIYDTENLQNDLISLANKLPAASRTFFINELTAPTKKPSHATDIIKVAKRAEALLRAMMFQCMFQDLDNYHEENSINQNLLENTTFLRTFALLMNSLLSQIAFQNTIQELLAKGDDESLFNAVRIDKSIVCADIFQHRIAKAQLSSDMQFFTKLGNNIAYNPLAKEAMYYEAYIVLRTFWLAGLNLLKPKDMDDFLTDCGIPHQPKPESLKRFIERHLHPIYGH